MGSIPTTTIAFSLAVALLTRQAVTAEEAITEQLNGTWSISVAYSSSTRMQIAGGSSRAYVVIEVDGTPGVNHLVQLSVDGGVLHNEQVERSTGLDTGPILVGAGEGRHVSMTPISAVRLLGLLPGVRGSHADLDLKVFNGSGQVVLHERLGSSMHDIGLGVLTYREGAVVLHATAAGAVYLSRRDPNPSHNWDRFLPDTLTGAVVAGEGDRLITVTLDGNRGGQSALMREWSSHGELLRTMKLADVAASSTAVRVSAGGNRMAAVITSTETGVAPQFIHGSLSEHGVRISGLPMGCTEPAIGDDGMVHVLCVQETRLNLLSLSEEGSWSVRSFAPDSCGSREAATVDHASITFFGKARALIAARSSTNDHRSCLWAAPVHLKHQLQMEPDLR